MMFSGVWPGVISRAEMPSVQAEAATSRVSPFWSGCDQSRPASLSSISRSVVVGIGHPQQRFRQHHQRQAFLGR